MKDLLEYLARGLVEEPDEVQVNEVQEDDGVTVLELSVAEDDYGNVIGRGGRTAVGAAHHHQDGGHQAEAARVRGHRRLLMEAGARVIRPDGCAPAGWGGPTAWTAAST